ncbi:hypothetical protein DERF_007443 [Dermatophagoides farinae]|uniref:Uncharacterized protein n=1 Tax=Dermatophagoides farinae TaxID=6954 RepID=A0A922I284_DERFA|nr:hypothetical protein DERF_007443 [Dermatophagoides farinae]
MFFLNNNHHHHHHHRLFIHSFKYDDADDDILVSFQIHKALHRRTLAYHYWNESMNRFIIIIFTCILNSSSSSSSTSSSTPTLSNILSNINVYYHHDDYASNKKNVKHNNIPSCIITLIQP